ncbi:MAG: glycoside hydrolase family 140 protein [Lewinella sp.]|nr:glycoside hydrolase family 140 protein [Lewinella sp.]
MRRFVPTLCFLALAALLYGQPPRLQVSDNGRFLMTETGEPFFWLGDTGWLLFAKLDRAEAARYLDDRAAKGFNVIQVMVLHQLEIANAYGDAALVDGDVSRPLVTDGDNPQDSLAYDYWDHIDYICDLAAERGLYLALVPVWGSNVRAGKVSEAQAGAYATWLARRMADRTNIIWLNGGDTRGDQNMAVWDTIGQSIRANAPGQLISFHPFGRTGSSQWFHKATWLDFNMFQSGHRRYDQDDSDRAYGQDNWKYVRDDYALLPPKPTLDGEPSYEGIPQGLHDPSEPYWTADDVRRYAYWSAFAGACGFTYGHSAVMQMHQPGDEQPAYGVREYWTEALDAEGARQMAYLKELMLSLPYFERVPAPSLIADGQGTRYDCQVATRGENFALVYTYNGREITVATSQLPGETYRASWFNPRNGETITIGEFDNTGTRTFDPPGNSGEGLDWVLVLQDPGDHR